MNYVKLGNTGLDVSRLCLGCMSFGDNTVWKHKWVLNESDSEEIVKNALDLGINFFDTANVYSLGSSEEYVGRILKKHAKRDEIVVATKLYMSMREGRPNSLGLSRKAIMQEIDGSLKRLGMDYIDLYIIHRFDYNTPIEETLVALNDLVRSGKVRYIGASAMFAWQFLKMLNFSEVNNLAKFVTMQNHYNLIYREEEREMLPLCVDQKIATTPYSPLAAGRLVRSSQDETQRKQTDATASQKYDATIENDSKVIERVAEIAKKRGVSNANIALSWLLSQPTVVSPIIGVTKLPQLKEAYNALSTTLTIEEKEYLQHPYVAHPIVGAL